MHGSTELPAAAVCVVSPGKQVTIALETISIPPDLHLACELDYGNRELSWGELTHKGKEVVAWTATVGKGYLYLPAGPEPSFFPFVGETFANLDLNSDAEATLSELKARGAAGVSFPSPGTVQVFSPDRPNGLKNPIQVDEVRGWLRVGVCGVDGVLKALREQNEELGNPEGTSYAGVSPFEVHLFPSSGASPYDEASLLAEFVASASFDSRFAVELDIPAPCSIFGLDVLHMQLTSTACFVGGEVMLPKGGVSLKHWDLQLVPTGSTDDAGVVSVRTGRILLTAAGIAEPKHFAKPFGLTWGEMLASGNLGQLFLDFNNWGQRFDGLNFSSNELALSAFDPATTVSPYLAVSGMVSLPFFGMHFINVLDTRVPDVPSARHVTVPKTPQTPSAAPTQLALTGTWHDVNLKDLAKFECADVDVNYHEESQNGFFGTGTGTLSFLHSPPLVITVEIHNNVTDVRITSEAEEDVHGLYLDVEALTALSGIAGSARIEGTTLKRISVFGYVENDASLLPAIVGKADFYTEVNVTVTPTTLDFYASGTVALSLGPIDCDATGTLHLLHDYSKGLAEGEVNGRVDFDTSGGTLSGEGQFTWHHDSTVRYLQGRLKVQILSSSKSGLEGSFFIGRETPKNLAWVLDPTDAHFGTPKDILPEKISGIYVYGQESAGFNLYVLSGGVDTYVGFGAFIDPTKGSTIAGTCGVYIHGEILGGLVSASAWANLSLNTDHLYFQGTVGLKGCVAWFLCKSTHITATYNQGGLSLE